LKPDVIKLISRFLKNYASQMMNDGTDNKTGGISAVFMIGFSIL